MIEKLYTVEEVASLASVTGRTIRNYLKSGRLVGRKIGGQWRFPESEVQRLLSGGEATSMELPAEEPDYTPAPEAEPYAYEPSAPAAQMPGVEAQTPAHTAPPINQPVLQPAPAPAFTVAAEPTRPAAAQPTATAVPASGGQAPQHSSAPPKPSPAADPAARRPNPYPGQSVPAVTPAPAAPAPTVAAGDSDYATPTPSGSSAGQVGYKAPAPLPTEPAAPPAPGQSIPGTEYNSGYTSEPYTETYDYAYEQAPAQPEAPQAPAAEEPQDPGVPALSDTGLKVLQFVAEVHDCTAGAQTCSVVEILHTLQTAQATITQLASLAAAESEAGIPCECYVEFDERFSVARYTLLGSTRYLAYALQLIQ